VRALSSKAKGSFLILEYQKSSAALSLATQLVVGGKCLTTNTAVRSWVRVWWVGDDFWYSSMRSPSTTPSPSELSDLSTLSTLSKKIAPQKSEATRPGGEGVCSLSVSSNVNKLQNPFIYKAFKQLLVSINFNCYHAMSLFMVCRLECPKLLNH